MKDCFPITKKRWAIIISSSGGQDLSSPTRLNLTSPSPWYHFNFLCHTVGNGIKMLHMEGKRGKTKLD